MHGAEVHAIDQDTAFGDTAKEAAVEASLVEFQQELVVVSLGQRHNRPSGLFAEEEGVEPNLAGREDVEAKTSATHGHDRGEQAAQGDFGNIQKKAGVAHGMEDKGDVATHLVVVGEVDGIGGEVEASARIVGVEEERGYVADHIEQQAGFGKRIGRERQADQLTGDGGTVGHTRLLDVLVGRVGAAVDVVVGIGDMVHAFEPSEEALLATVGLPHSQEGADVVHHGETPENESHLLIDGSCDAHGFNNAIVETFIHTIKKRRLRKIIFQILCFYIIDKKERESVTLLYGIIIGVALGFVFGYGASFFSMMQTGAHYGFRKTLPMVYGIITSDAIRVALLLGVFANIVGLDTVADILKRPWMMILGSCVLIAVGIYTMTRKSKQVKQKGGAVKCESTDNPHWSTLFWHGFALNFLNPLAWFFWLTVVIVVSPLFDNAPTARIYVFFTGVLLAEFGCNILKCWLSSQLQRLFSAQFMNVFNKIVGMILIGFALYILFAMVIFRDKTPEPDTHRATEVIMGVMPPEMLQDSGATTPHDTTQ